MTQLSNILIDRSVASYISDEYPQFVSFIKSYYEYLEQSGYAHDTITNLRDFRTIDKTLDDYVDYFCKEFLVNIPVDTFSDKRLLVEHIKKFYINKGNENSFKFLFRILFNEDIELYYPKVDILRASDGKWYQQNSIFISLDSVIFPYLVGATIEGVLSGAKALVEDAISYENRGTNLIEFILSNIKGQFLTSENIIITYFDEDQTEQTITKSLLTMYTDVFISNRGGKYKIDDLFKIRNELNQEVGYGKVIKTSKGPVTGLTIDAPGINYNGNIQQITKVYALHFDDVWNGRVVGTYNGVIDDSNDVDVWALTHDQTISAVNRVGTGDIIRITDEPTSSGNGAMGVVSMVGNDGEILTVALLSGGDLYKTPEASVISTTGTGAEISCLGGGGGIDDVKIIHFPIVLNSDISQDYYQSVYSVYPDFTDKGDGSALGQMLVGALAEYPGLYLNDDGHLSSTKKLQDNYYYQDYSYVIKVAKDVNKFADIIKKSIHPAGTKMFGEYFDISVVEIDTSISLEVGISLESIASVPLSEESSIVKLYDYDGENYTPILDSDGNWLIDY